MDIVAKGHKSSRPHKIAIIGAGKIGQELWKELSERGAADEIVVWNRSDKHENDAFRGMQRAVDQANLINANHRSTSQFKFKTGAENLDAAIINADIVIVTAGVARKKGMQRADLLSQNCEIIDPVAKSASHSAPNATYLIATNPVDTMTQRFQEESGIPAERIMGLSGELDKARLTQSICNKLHIAPEQIEGAAVIGQHGPAMVPVLNNIRVHHGNGQNSGLMETTSPETIQAIRDETIEGGGILINLIGTSDHIAPAAALRKMTQAVIDSKWKNVPDQEMIASVYSNQDGFYTGRPISINTDGSYKLESLPPLSAVEKERWRDSHQATLEALAELPGRQSGMVVGK